MKVKDLIRLLRDNHNLDDEISYNLCTVSDVYDAVPLEVEISKEEVELILHRIDIHYYDCYGIVMDEVQKHVNEFLARKKSRR